MSLQAIIRLLEFADTLDEVDVGMTQMWKDGVPHCFAGHVAEDLFQTVWNRDAVVCLIGAGLTASQASSVVAANDGVNFTRAGSPLARVKQALRMALGNEKRSIRKATSRKNIHTKKLYEWRC